LEIRTTADNKVLFQYYEKPMVPNMVLHRRSAMPEATRRATLNQELIRRMVNTSEMVSDERRVQIVDNYAEKLMNSEYPLEQTRNIIVGGLKGYERLLSLSKDKGNPRWKPLHMAAGWNAKNRRIAKQRAKTSWYKGKSEVDPPANTSTHLEEASIHEEETGADENHILPGGSRQDTTLAVPVGERDGNGVFDKTYQKDKNASVQSIHGGHPDGEKRTLSQITILEGWKNQNPDDGIVMSGPDGLVSSLVNENDVQIQTSQQEDQPGQVEVTEVPKQVKQAGKRKKRGNTRETITLGGLKKVEKALKRKAKNKMRKKLGKLGVPEGRNMRRGKGPLAPIRSVMFVDNSGGGELARRLQEAEEGLGRATGYRVRIVESAGTPLGMLLPSTNPWGPPDCDRHDCVPCGQGDDKRMDCRKRNLLYENRCEACNKDGQKDGKVLADGKGIYVGETSRSMYERAKEHEADKMKKSEDSHQIKHWLTEHQDLLEPPKFRFKIIQTFQDPLSRQLAEAVRIDLRGDNILNSKSEYSRCKVPRLTVDLEGWTNATKVVVQQQHWYNNNRGSTRTGCPTSSTRG
jgi:hypothetical protein